jgi:hypothetical protein
MLHVTSAHSGQTVSLSVFDLKGRVVYRKAIAGSVSLSLCSMVRANGSYIVTVRNATDMLFMKRVMMLAGN